MLLGYEMYPKCWTKKFNVWRCGTLVGMDFVTNLIVTFSDSSL